MRRTAVKRKLVHTIQSARISSDIQRAVIPEEIIDNALRTSYSETREDHGVRFPDQQKDREIC